MTREEYHAYLRSPEWLARRAEVLKRAQGRCADCVEERRVRGAASGFMAWPAAEVHHLTYERVGREDLGDLVALCERHHRARHGVDPQRDREIADMQRQVTAAPEWEPAPDHEPGIAEQLGVKAVEKPWP